MFLKKSSKPHRGQVKVLRRPPKAYDSYRGLLRDVAALIEQGRVAAVRSVNVVLTSTYWLVGRRIVEHEQSGAERASYGETVLKRLARDLTAQLGRGFLNETSSRCACSIWVGQFRRQCLRNLQIPQFRRHCLRNLVRALSSPCHGRTTCACSQSPTRKPASITNAKRCWAGGRSANSTARSRALPTREREGQRVWRPPARTCPWTRR